MNGRGGWGLQIRHSAAAKACSAQRHIVQGLLAVLGASARRFTFCTQACYNTRLFVHIGACCVLTRTHGLILHMRTTLLF